MNLLWKDLKYAARMLTKTPAFVVALARRPGLRPNVFECRRDASAPRENSVASRILLPGRRRHPDTLLVLGLQDGSNRCDERRQVEVGSCIDVDLRW